MQRIQVRYQPRSGGATLAPRAIGGRSRSGGGRGRLRMLLLLAALLALAAAAGLGAIGSGGGGSNPPNTAQVRAEEAYAQQAFGNSPSQQQCLVWLWNRESGWDPAAANPTSDARGIAQNINGWGPGYTPSDWQGQIQWGKQYIDQRYQGAPCNAWDHEETAGWY